MSRVGLVLGGGGITGASYEFATLMAIHMATGWEPRSADAIIGTSAGSFVAATVRSGHLSLDSIVRRQEGPDDVANRIKAALFRRNRPHGVGKWLIKGLVPSLRSPGLSMVLGAPAPFQPDGIGEWLSEEIGALADGWPEQPTVIVAYELEGRRRVPFGTDAAPDVTLRDAVSASSAVPLVFSPHKIGNRHYVDGGVTSGTHADLLLGSEEPFDFLLVIAPLGADVEREGARFYETMFDRVGREALDEELNMIRGAWPRTEILVITPSPDVQTLLKPNPMSSSAAVPVFIKTLASLRLKLARPQYWEPLSTFLRAPSVR